MAMDHFMEEVVVKRRKGFQDTLYYLATITMVMTALLGFTWLPNLLSGNFHIVIILVTLLMLGTAVYLFFYKDRIRTEYEYTFTNGELDFAQVYNNKKRKALGTMRVRNVEAFGPVDSEGFRKLINMPELTRKNWFLNREAALHYFYYQKDGKKIMIILEPSQAMADMIRKYLPHGGYRA